MRSILILFITLMLGSSAFGQSLTEYIQYAIENNPGLKASHLEFESAMEKVNQSRILPDPNFSVGYFISPVETRVGPQQARLSLSQKFPWFGTLKAKEKVLTLQAEAQFAAYENSRNALIQEVEQQYYNLYELDKTTQFIEENIDLLKSIHAIVLKKYENGYGSLANVIRLEMMIEQLQTQHAIIGDEWNAYERQFNSLLNRSREDQVTVMDSLPEMDFAFALTDSTFDNHPNVLAFSYKEKAMAAQEQLISKQGLPDLGLGLDYILVGESKANMAPEGSGKNAFMPMVTMSLPIFRKKYNSMKKEAQLLQQAYSSRQADVKTSYSGQLAMQEFQFTKQMQLIELYGKQTQSLKRVLDLLTTSYSNSGKDFEELITVQEQLLDYQLKKLKAEVTLYKTRAKVNYLTGILPDGLSIEMNN